MYQRLLLKGDDDGLEEHLIQFFQDGVHDAGGAEGFDAVLFHLDQDAGSRPAFQQSSQLAETGESRIGETRAETFRITGRKSTERRVIGLHDHVVVTGQLQDVRIVAEHRHAVGGQLHVSFDVRGARVQHCVETKQRILRIT